jgi:hypothetical protein
MCTLSEEATGTALIVPDANLCIGIGRTRLPNNFFYFSDLVLGQLKLRAESPKKVKNCKGTVNGLTQMTSRPPSTGGNGARRDLEGADWELLLLAACWHGRFREAAKTPPLVVVTGDVNVSKVAQSEFSLDVSQKRSARQTWYLISSPEGCAAGHAVLDASPPPFLLP